jgi:hypothetical protein
MLSFEDERWNDLTGGYRVPLDPRSLLRRLDDGKETAAVWRELWEELHHQGDVGDASYGAVPHIVRIHRKRGIVDWNTYAIVAVIESARTNPRNPKIPEWLEKDYLSSIQELAETGVAEISRTNDPQAIRAILGIIAIAKGLRTHGRFLVEYAEDELLDLESRL